MGDARDSDAAQLAQYARFLKLFREHAAAMHKLGYAHVSVKHAGFEAHFEGFVSRDSTPAVGGAIGFVSGDE